MAKAKLKAKPVKRKPAQRRVAARYDAARITPENSKHLAMADGLSARAANSPAVRKAIRNFSRLEFDNCSWYSGAIRTAAIHIVGTGPRLQILTENPEFNARIEKLWRRWSSSVNLAGKLRTMVEARWRDGESFAMKVYRPRLWPVALDVRLYEADQVAEPFMRSSIGDPLVDDGIRIDPLSNEIEYFIYDHHPGGTSFLPTHKGNWYPARDVIHLFHAERPEQIRGIPPATSALPLFAILRRHTLATLLAAETAANLAGILKTVGANVTPAISQDTDFQLIDIPRNSLLQVPEGMDLSAFHAEAPGTTHEMFQRQTLMEIFRCMNMPYGLGAGTSKDSNFSSHKGDMKNIWEPAVKVEQHHTELTAVDPIFIWFLEELAITTVELDGAPPIMEIDHQWFWPPLPTLDETDAANAAVIRISSGQSSRSGELLKLGTDVESNDVNAAADLGVDVVTYRRMLASKLLSVTGQAVPADMSPAVVDVNDQQLQEVTP